MEKIEINQVRNVPHTEGNFSTHIYLKVMNKSKKVTLMINRIKSILEIHKNLQETNYNNTFNNNNDSNIDNKLVLPKIKYNDVISKCGNYFHISLCKNLYLKYHQIESFKIRIKNAIQNFNKKINLILMPRVKYFNNEYNNRNFLTLEILQNIQLKTIIKIISDIIKEFGLDNDLMTNNLNIFDKKKFTPHISILWTDTNFENIISEELINEKLKKDEDIKLLVDKGGCLKILNFDDIYFNIGLKTEKIKLKN